MTSYDEGPGFRTYGPEFHLPNLPRQLERNSFLPLFYGGLAGVFLVVLEYGAIELLDEEGSLLLYVLAGAALSAVTIGIWAVLAVPDLTYRVTLLREGVGLRTWKGDRSVAYADIRVVSLYFRGHGTGSSGGRDPMLALECSAGAEEALLVDSEDVHPDYRERVRAEAEAEDAAGEAEEALHIELRKIEPDDRVLLARVLEQSAERAHFDEPAKRLLAGVQPTRGDLE